MKPAPKHKAYTTGDSWTEELAFSADEFRSAFDNIGKRHKSKTTFSKVKDKFGGKY